MSSSSDRKAKIQAAAPKKQGTANAIVVAGIVGIIALIAVIGGVIWASQQDQAGDGGAPAGTEMGQPFTPYPDVTPVEGAPVVDVYEDFRCPACKVFEDAFGESITTLAKDGKIDLRVHLKTVIDSNDGTDNSQIAGSSALCAADQGVWESFHKTLFATQPAEHGPFTDEALKQAAQTAGLSGDKLAAWEECSTGERYADYVKSVDEASAKEGVNGTPALKVDDTMVAWGNFVTANQQPDIAAFEEALTSGDIPADKVESQ